MSNTALKKIQKNFPSVTRVRDSKGGIKLEVTEKDCKTASKKDPNNCALAKACKRQLNIDGAIIGISYSWLIKGNTATRFQTGENVSREIVSFDRHHDFAPGKGYSLRKVTGGNRLGYNRIKKGLHGKTNRKQRPSPRKVIYHKTSNVRTIKKLS